MSENKLDMIDDYLSNKLNTADRNSFEESLQNDTTLQNEVSLQKDIINSIKDIRKSELKARLNNLPTPTGLTNLQKFGIVAVTISAGALLTLGLIQTSEKPLTDTTTEKPVVTERSIALESETTSELVSPSKEIEKEVIEETKPSAKKPVLNQPSSQPESVTTSILPTPSPGMHHIEDPEGVHHNSEALPKNGLSNDDKTTTASYKTTLEHSSKKFMYKYDGEHLTLIGDFSAKPYTVLETVENGNKKLFLKYDSKFYGISESKKAIDFSEIKNTELILELKKK